MYLFLFIKIAEHAQKDTSCYGGEVAVGSWVLGCSEVLKSFKGDRWKVKGFIAGENKLIIMGVAEERCGFFCGYILISLWLNDYFYDKSQKSCNIQK